MPKPREAAFTVLKRKTPFEVRALRRCFHNNRLYEKGETFQFHGNTDRFPNYLEEVEPVKPQSGKSRVRKDSTESGASPEPQSDTFM